MKNHWIKKAVFIPLMVAAGLVVFGGAVMLLWNSILPGLIHVGEITFWQALGLLVLSKILFGGGWAHRGGQWGHKRHHWMHMSEEEKEKFRAEWKQRCGPMQNC
jgi:Ca2+/H+ antiporter, TMEM165/GDT1 family